MTTKAIIDPDLHYLTGVFGGIDGGADYVRLRAFIEGMKRCADEGDEAAAKIIKVLRQFTMLVKVATKERS